MTAAFKNQCFTYTRRRPELTPCYQVVQNYLDTFIADRQEEGRPLPDYVISEFEAYLKCGILAHGFLRLKCQTCDEEKIVAFSCKRRGFCPSCCAKRMMEAATHLVENVLPHVPYRQFVISFPFPLRFWMQANKKLYDKIHALVITEIHRFYTDKASANGIYDSTPGSIAFTQRFGSALNVNPHMHVLCPDGIYIRVNGNAQFRKLDSITDQEVETLVKAISKKVLKYLKKKGYLNQEGEIVENPITDDLFNNDANTSLSQATINSIAGKIAFGPNTGKYVTRIGSGFGYGEETSLLKGKCCASINGFSLHANTKINTLARDKLQKLIEYIARGPLSNERLEITEDNKVKLRLKTRFTDGTSHLLFTMEEFLEKLTALIPPSKTHLVRWAGVFASKSNLRPDIILNPKKKKGFQFSEVEENKGFKNNSWSKMLAKAFKIDVEKCELCGGKLIKICAVLERNSIIRYLTSLDIDYDPPPRAPPKSSQQDLCFEQNHSIEE